MPSGRVFDELRSVFILKDMGHQTDRIEVFNEQLLKEFQHLGEGAILKGINDVRLSAISRPNIDDFRKAIKEGMPKVQPWTECEFCLSGVISMIETKTGNSLAFACKCNKGGVLASKTGYPRWNGRREQEFTHTIKEFQGNYTPWFIYEKIQYMNGEREVK